MSTFPGSLRLTQIALWSTSVWWASEILAADAIRPPGHRPQPASAHALVGGRVVVKPGQEFERGTIVLRDGRIVAVGSNVAVPADARVHDMVGTTIYAGFIDAHVNFAKSGETRVAAMKEGPPVDAADELTSGAGTGFLGVASVAVGGNANSLVTPERRMAREYAPVMKSLEALRGEGFTAANAVPDRGVIRGMSVLVSLGSGNPNEVVIRPDTFQHVSLDVPKGKDPDDDSERPPDPYPHSLMGVISAVRQTFFDAQFQAGDFAHFAAHPKDRPRPAFDASLDALQPAVRKTMPVVFESSSMLMVDRARHLSQELTLQPILLASGQEWRRPEFARNAGAPFIVPVDFPEVPKLPEDDDWLAVPFEQLRAWDHAPGNPALLRREGREIALTTNGLEKKARFRGNVRLALARGLSEADAI
ncbi:MAG TPA: hypothetical protein VFG14_00425, partial [Chthoniobacteraceae bacterium]|nr:hypothetical protein [Chthoniobacteraceae bacterium]